MNELIMQYVREYGMAALTSFLATFGGGLGTGCAMFDPGGQVRRGLEQAKIYEWRGDGSFWVEGKGTQTERFTMIQGSIKMKEGAEGEPTIDWENSGIEYYLSADPSADVAGTAMGLALAASTEQVKVLSKTVDGLISAVIPLIAPVPNTETP